MPRSCIGAALAFLVLLAPTAASADPPSGHPHYPAAELEKAENFLVQSERITDVPGRDRPLVQSERITDHRPQAPTGSLAGTTDETTAALAHEQIRKSQSDAGQALVRAQDSGSGPGIQGVPNPGEDDTPWVTIAFGIAGTAVLVAGLTVATRRTRKRVAA